MKISPLIKNLQEFRDWIATLPASLPKSWNKEPTVFPCLAIANINFGANVISDIEFISESSFTANEPPRAVFGRKPAVPVQNDKFVPAGGLKIGGGATYSIGSDRYPYTIVEILSPTRVILQRDNYKRIDKNGMSESQVYKFSPNPEAARIEVSRRRNGIWRKKGDSSGIFSFHDRSAYQDPCF